LLPPVLRTPGYVAKDKPPMAQFFILRLASPLFRASKSARGCHGKPDFLPKS
jgi:hypothetical protein